MQTVIQQADDLLIDVAQWDLSKLKSLRLKSPYPNRILILIADVTARSSNIPLLENWFLMKI